MELVREHPAEASFHRISDSTFRVPPPPDFFFGPFPGDVANYYFRAHIGLGPVGTFRVRDLGFVGAFTLTHGGSVLVCSELNIHPAHVAEEALALPHSPRPVRRADGSFAYILGPGYHIFGHWLADFLPKLHVLAACGHDPASLTFLIPRATPAWGRELLRLLGIGEGQLHEFDTAREIVEAGEVLLPTFLHNGVRFADLFREAVGFLSGRARAACATNAPALALPEKIYISRLNFTQSRALVNNDMAERIAREYGFEVVYPERLSLAEQVMLFGRVRAILGEYGSAHHWSMFARPGTVVCGLRGSTYHPGFIQSGIGRALDQPTGYVFGENIAGDPRGAIAISEQALRTCLDTIGQFPSP